MSNKNYYIRQSESWARIMPKTAADEKLSAWKTIFSIVVDEPIAAPASIVLNFRTIKNATDFCDAIRWMQGNMGRIYATVPRHAQDAVHTSAQAVAEFWMNLWKTGVQPTLPEEVGEGVFVLPLMNGQQIHLDFTHTRWHKDAPTIVRIPWSWSMPKSTMERFVETERPLDKNISDAIHTFLANNHFPKGAVFSPIVAHAEEKDGQAKLVMQIPMTQPKEEYAVEITNPQGQKFWGILIVDPSEELKKGVSQ